MTPLFTPVVLLQREDLTRYPMLQLVAQEVGADWWAKVVHGATSCEECPSYEEGAQRIAEQDEAEPESLGKGLDDADIHYLNTYGEWPPQLKEVLKEVKKQTAQKRKREEEDEEEPTAKKAKTIGSF